MDIGTSNQLAVAAMNRSRFKEHRLHGQSIPALKVHLRGLWLRVTCCIPVEGVERTELSREVDGRESLPVIPAEAHRGGYDIS